METLGETTLLLLRIRRAARAPKQLDHSDRAHEILVRHRCPQELPVVNFTNPPVDYNKAQLPELQSFSFHAIVLVAKHLDYKMSNGVESLQLLKNSISMKDSLTNRV